MGIWDKRIQHRVIGFAGLLLLLLVGHVAAVVSGAPFFSHWMF